MEGDSVSLNKLLRGANLHFCLKMSSQLRQKMQRLLVVKRVSRPLHRATEGKLWENNWVAAAGSGKEQHAEKYLSMGGRPAESFQQNLQNRPVRCGVTFLQTFLVDQAKHISVAIFCDVSESVGWKVPVVDNVVSSQEQEIYPTTSLDENCIE